MLYFKRRSSQSNHCYFILIVHFLYGISTIVSSYTLFGRGNDSVWGSSQLGNFINHLIHPNQTHTTPTTAHSQTIPPQYIDVMYDVDYEKPILKHNSNQSSHSRYGQAKYGLSYPKPYPYRTADGPSSNQNQPDPPWEMVRKKTRFYDKTERDIIVEGDITPKSPLTPAPVIDRISTSVSDRYLRTTASRGKPQTNTSNNLEANDGEIGDGPSLDLSSLRQFFAKEPSALITARIGEQLRILRSLNWHNVEDNDIEGRKELYVFVKGLKEWKCCELQHLRPWANMGCHCSADVESILRMVTSKAVYTRLLKVIDRRSLGRVLEWLDFYTDTRDERVLYKTLKKILAIYANTKAIASGVTSGNEKGAVGFIEAGMDRDEKDVFRVNHLKAIKSKGSTGRGRDHYSKPEIKLTKKVQKLMKNGPSTDELYKLLDYKSKKEVTTGPHTTSTTICPNLPYLLAVTLPFLIYPPPTTVDTEKLDRWQRNLKKKLGILNTRERRIWDDIKNSRYVEKKGKERIKLKELMHKILKKIKRISTPSPRKFLKIPYLKPQKKGTRRGTFHRANDTLFPDIDLKNLRMKNLKLKRHKNELIARIKRLQGKMVEKKISLL